MKIPRVLITAPLAFIITFALFLGMRALIEGARRQSDEKRAGLVTDFIRVPTDSVTQQKVREKPKRTPPPKEPPPPKLSTVDNNSASATIDAPKTNFKTTGFSPGGSFRPRGGFNPGARPTGDQDATPIVRVEPMYPRRAAERGITGYVVVKFRVGTAGQVINPTIVDADPRGVFEQAVLKAVRKWKYNPKVVDGKAIEYGVTPVRLEFNL